MQWQEVKRRKPGTSNEEEITSFYVTNVPRDARRSDIWKPCSKFGRLTDVYVPGRRDKGGAFFAFVKYANVSNPDDIVQALNEVSVGGRYLKANVSLHPRKPAATIRIVTRRHPPTQVHRPPPPSNRDGRSFADVTKGENAMEAPNRMKPKITLTKSSQINDWLSNAALVGEVRSFDLLCGFPSVLEMEGYNISEIKYEGGLRIIMKFTSNSAAEAFRLNKCIWLKWFNWVQQAGKKDTYVDRIAWIKIMGVPLFGMDEANMAIIAGQFGKILVNNKSFWSSNDISHGKACIITQNRIKINDEILVDFDGVTYHVGVSEVDDYWFPFKPFKPALYSESEEEEADEDEELEEGEIPATIDNLNSEARNAPTSPQVSRVADTPKEQGAEYEKKIHESTPTLDTLDDSVTANTGSNAGANNINQEPTHAHTPLQAQAPTEPTTTGSANSPSSVNGVSSPEFQFGDSALKRRRIKMKTNKIKRKKNPSRKPPILNPPNFDLNVEATASQNQSSSELNQTKDVGAMVGFHFENDGSDMALLGDGVKTGFP
ncbi:hypothetical protein LXL04_012692 [Taraxacum kok-saghyz]